MTFTRYQMASFRSFLGLSIPRKKFTKIATLKSRRYYGSTQCESSKNVLQTNSGATVYPKSIWSHDFIQGLETNITINSMEKAKKLEEKVAAMIGDYENGCLSNLELLELIDSIERLGLGYRLKNIIRRVLDKIAKISENSLAVEEGEDNLHVVSLKFRLLRQHGYNVSQDFIRGFKDTHGGLTGCLPTDVKVLLSIYEASYLSVEGDIDLHDAGLFATELLLNKSSHEKEVMEDVDHALDIPLHRRILRLEARWYIDTYGKRKDANQLLLDLAILDFNMVQSALRRDLQEASKWWKNIDLASKLGFTRDRLVECFFWSAGMVFEPQYYFCRIGLTKVCILITTMDDIYDANGSFEELKVFTDAVKRWDINAIKYMPGYLQLSFLALYNTITEMGYHTLGARGDNIIPILAKLWGELFEAFFVEAKWSHTNCMPSLEDYLDNAWRSASGVVILSHGYLLLNQDVKREANDRSLEKYHDLFKWSSMIFRLWNDLATSSDEIESGKSANAISCYMHEHGVCEEVAHEYIKTLIDQAWMKMIEAQVACSGDLEDPIIDMAINLARVAHCTYQHGDGHGAPDARAHDRVSSMIIEPVTTKEKEHQHLT